MSKPIGMSRLYEVRSGDRPLAVREAQSAHSALLDFVRAMGCQDHELMRLGENAVSWRGAIFRAEPVEDEAQADAPADPQLPYRRPV